MDLPLAEDPAARLGMSPHAALIAATITVEAAVVTMTLMAMVVVDTATTDMTAAAAVAIMICMTAQHDQIITPATTMTWR